MTGSKDTAAILMEWCWLCHRLWMGS